MAPGRFSFRWGIPWLDAGFVQVPNFFFERYLEVGLTRPEFLFLLHLARYKFDSEKGVARPSLMKVAKEMGYGRRQVQRIVKSLEDKKWLVVTERPGKPSEYNFEKLARALLHAAQDHDKNVTRVTHVTGTLDTHVTGGVSPMSHEEEETRIGNPEEESHLREKGGDRDDVARRALEIEGYAGQVARAMVAEFGGERVLVVVREFIAGGETRVGGDWIREELGRGVGGLSEDSEEGGKDD